MTLTEIKKLLYKEKPEATFIHASETKRGIFLVYDCTLDKASPHPDTYFEVPVEELGEGLFGNTIGAQLLIRYIIQPENNTNAPEIQSFEEWDAMQDEAKILEWGSSNKEKNSPATYNTSAYKDAPLEIRKMFYDQYVHFSTNPTTKP